jgi:subtilisin family serine protease
MPWQDNPEWDDALEQSPDIAIGGGSTPDGRPATEFLYRKGQLVCERAVWDDPTEQTERDLRSRLVAAGAQEIERARQDERSVRNADAARNLDLQLLDVPEDDLHGLVREARALVVDALSFVHVMVANPQRHGGCAPPRPLPRPTAEIPGVGVQARGKLVAVLDTGIVDPPPFPVETVASEDFEPAGVAGPATEHGTMVAGVIARYAPGARILIRRVLNTPLGEADELDIALALAALPEEVDIVNASFGGAAADDATMLIFERAVAAMPRKTLVVASAGNEGVNRPHFMAAFKRVIGVASAEQAGTGDWEVADYSKRGYWVDLSAAGTDVETVIGNGQHVAACGTSFAAPQVAARAADIAVQENLDVREAASRLVLAPGAPAVTDGGTFVPMP